MKSSTFMLTTLIYSFSSLSLFGQNCQVKKAPFFENFDGNTFVSGSGYQGPGSIDSCWTRNTIVYYWRVGPSNQRTPETGPQTDHTTGHGNYIFTESGSTITTPVICNLQSPVIDLDTLSSPKLTFFTHLFGSYISSLKVYVNNGTGWNLEHTITGQQQNKRIDPWVKVSVDLFNYMGDTVQIRFTGERVPYTANSGHETDMSIDDFRISNGNSCESPQDLLVSFETDIKAGLEWIGGGAGNWNVSYGPTGTPPQSGALVNSASPNLVLTGLTPSTSYDVYVRDSCGLGKVSTWYGPINFTTECSPVAAPFIENFDSSNFPLTTSFPPCWGKTSEGSDFYFIAEQGATYHPYSGPSGDHTSGTGKYVFSRKSGGSAFNPYAKAVFNTPLIDLGNLTKPSLSFWYHMYGIHIDSMAVFIESGSGITKALSIIGQQQSTFSDPWKLIEVDLSDYINDTIQVAFASYKYSVSGNATNVSIDDIVIDEAPTCPVPYILHVDKITGNSVTLSWSAAAPSNWQLKYRSTTSSGAFTYISTTNNPITINGLNSRTEYEFYVRDSCGTTSGSQWLGPLLVTTDCPLYTIPYFENFDSTDWVPGVSLANQGNKISPCWTRPDSLAPNFGTLSGPTTSTLTGPAYGKGGSGKYIYTEASGSNYPGTGEITSPKIYINPLRVTPYLLFAYHMYGTDIISLEVEVGNENGFTNIYTITGAQQTSTTDFWQNQLVSLAQFSGDTIQVRFKGSFSGFKGDVAIDNFLVAAQHCPLASTSFTDSMHFLAASFNLDSAKATDSLYWDFGDGNDTSIVNPSHVYDTAGTYTVKLLAFNGCGNVDSTIKTITVCDSLWADFNVNQIGDTVTYTANPTPGAIAYYWDLGNGIDTLGSMIKYSYGNLDSVTVRMTVVNVCGDSITVFKNIQLCLPPEAYWGFHIVGTTSAGMQVQFDGSNSQNATSYHWSFGDGDTASGVSPIHIYSTPGLHYNVTLTVKNKCLQESINGAKLSEISLNEFELESLFELFPNPSGGKFTLTWPHNETMVESIQLVDMTGRELFQQKINQDAHGRMSVDISFIPKGNYVLRIQTPFGIVDKPIVLNP